MRDLYFLCTPAEFVPAETTIGPLLMIKTSQTETMYIATASRELAERLLQLRPMRGVEIVATNEVASKRGVDFSANRVLVIDSEPTLEELLKDGSGFPYEKHAIYHH
jgi:hypothetical protein